MKNKKKRKGLTTLRSVAPIVAALLFYAVQMEYIETTIKIRCCMYVKISRIVMLMFVSILEPPFLLAA